jgi:hypothetical protein
MAPITDLFGQWWNYFLGQQPAGSPPDAPIVPETPSSTQEQSATTSDQAESASVAPAIEEIVKKASTNTCLIQDLELLLVEGVFRAEAKARSSYQKLELLRNKQKVVQSGLAKLAATADPQGNVDLTNDHEGQKMIQALREHQIPVSNQLRFTKNERDVQIQLIESHNKTLETDLKLAIQETQEHTHMRQQIYQIVKGILDRYYEAMRAVFRKN